MSKSKSKSKKLSHEEFVRKAIVSLRKDGYKGIHSVFSGFNNAFKTYYDGADPVTATTTLADAGKILIKPAKKGVMLYLPGDAPVDRTSATLKAMGL